MKKYHLNKKEILYWASKARRYLNLPKIKINIKELLYPSQYQKRDTAYMPIEKCINFPKANIELILDKIGDIRYKYMTTKEICIFSLFHEIAHYFQFHNYSRWSWNNASYEKYLNFNGQHHEKHIEKIADKIAWILYTKLYNKFSKLEETKL